MTVWNDAQPEALPAHKSKLNLAGKVTSNSAYHRSSLRRSASTARLVRRGWGGGLHDEADHSRVEHSTAQRGASANGRLQRLDIAELLAKPAPPIDWMWDGYIEAGTFCLLHGDGGRHAHRDSDWCAHGLVRAAFAND